MSNCNCPLGLAVAIDLAPIKWQWAFLGCCGAGVCSNVLPFTGAVYSRSSIAGSMLSIHQDRVAACTTMATRHQIGWPLSFLSIIFTPVYPQISNSSSNSSSSSSSNSISSSVSSVNNILLVILVVVVVVLVILVVVVVVLVMWVVVSVALLCWIAKLVISELVFSIWLIHWSWLHW